MDKHDAKLLSRWYGYDVAAAEREKLVTADLEELVPLLVSKLKLGERQGFQKLVAEWPQFVGARAAVYTYPVEFRGHTLVIHCDHSVWRMELERERKALLNKISGQYPIVKALSFKM